MGTAHLYSWRHHLVLRTSQKAVKAQRAARKTLDGGLLDERDHELGLEASGQAF
jgi:hypothetical protein